MARASLSNLSTFLTKLKSIFSLIGHTHSQYVQNTTYNNKMSSLDSSVSTLSSGKLNLSGGTMTGNLTTSSHIISSSDTPLKNSSTTGRFNICGGTTTNDGASLFLGGQDFTSYPGWAWLKAKNATQQADIVIKPDGTTQCPTPATTDNSTKIATTAFVKAQKTLIYASVNYQCTSVNTFEYTGLTINIPANSYFALKATQIYVSGKPNGIAINYSSTTNPATTNWTNLAYTDTQGMISCCGYTSALATLYFWEKRKALPSFANQFIVQGWYETK